MGCGGKGGKWGVVVLMHVGKKKVKINLLFNEHNY